MKMTTESRISMALTQTVTASIRAKGDNYQRVAVLHAEGKRDITISHTLGISRERVRQIRVAHKLEKRPRWYGQMRTCKACGLSFEARGVAYSEERCIVHSLVEKDCGGCGLRFRGRFKTKLCLPCRRKQYQQKRRSAVKKAQWLKPENVT